MRMPLSYTRHEIVPEELSIPSEDFPRVFVLLLSLYYILHEAVQSQTGQMTLLKTDIVLLRQITAHHGDHRTSERYPQVP